MNIKIWTFLNFSNIKVITEIFRVPTWVILIQIRIISTAPSMFLQLRTFKTFEQEKLARRIKTHFKENEIRNILVF